MTVLAGAIGALAQDEPTGAPSGDARSRASASAEGVESRVELRLVDRATVRIVAVSGAEAAAFESERTGLTRVTAVPRAQHGSGVVVEPDGLILTARHVLWGADAMAVFLPGSDEPLPARVVYVDPDRDVAFLQIPGEGLDHVALPDTPRSVRMAESVTGSGYPIDVRQRYPAAVSGRIARETNDEALQLAMSVNRGNSGGPVIGEDGALLGILSRRGEPRAGIEGVALIEPTRFVLPGYARAQQEKGEEARAFSDAERGLARVVAGFVRTSDDEQPAWERTSLSAVRSAADRAPSQEAAMIVAAHAWNMQIALLEARRKRDAAGLDPADRQQVERLAATAVELSRRAFEQAPYLRFPYPIGRSIVNSDGRPFVPPTR